MLVRGRAEALPVEGHTKVEEGCQYMQAAPAPCMRFWLSALRAERDKDHSLEASGLLLMPGGVISYHMHKS